MAAASRSALRAVACDPLRRTRPNVRTPGIGAYRRRRRRPAIRASHPYTAPRQRPLPIIEGALLLTDRLPAWPCACSAGSGSGRCGAIDSEVPGATREIQRRNNQEEGCPSVDAVREAREARGGLDTPAGNVRDPQAAEVA